MDLTKFSNRLVYALEYTGISAYKLSQELGIGQSTISNYKKGKTEPNASIIKSIASILEINAEWLVSGIGSLKKISENDIMSSNNLPNEQIQQFEQYITNSNGNKYKELSDGNYLIEVKVVPFEAFARYASEFSSNEAESFGEWENVTFIVDRIGLGNYLGFRVKGDSMDGGLLNDTPDKAIVLARELGRQHWNDGFSPTKYGWIIVTKDNILFKDIIGFDKVNGTIKCHSRNQSPEYSDFDYPLNDVRQIFKVIKRTM